MKRGDLAFIGQLVDSLDDTLLKLQEAKEAKDYILFDKSKKSIIQLQKQITEALN
jgi:hypothetical protein